MNAQDNKSLVNLFHYTPFLLGFIKINIDLIMDIKQLLDIVTLKKIDENRFEGKNYETVWGRVFGGQVLSQSLHAAYQLSLIHISEPTRP